jgi:hypothetical protein
VTDNDPVNELVEHLRDCLKADAAIVKDGSADDVVAELLAAGWTLDSEVTYMAGKRIRMMHPPC